MKKANIALYLYPDLAKTAKLKCAIKGVSFNNYVADLIKRDLALNPMLCQSGDGHLQDSIPYEFGPRRSE